eukprot:COSAG02_NODE_324_length_24643_cov_107.975228_13_plen_43_part_00
MLLRNGSQSETNKFSLALPSDEQRNLTSNAVSIDFVQSASLH